MHFLKISTAFFAAVTVAEHQHGVQNFHHRRQMNTTSAPPSTTLTIFQTVVHTITSCAPTITNCPARSSAGGGVITDVVILTTTVCPVVAASSIASSIIAAAGGSSSAFTGTMTLAPINTPLSTGAAAGGLGANGGSSASDTVLTYTLGTGSFTTIVTTTIKHTTTETAYITRYITSSSSVSGGNPSQVTATGSVIGGSGQSGVAGAGSQTELTTTRTTSLTMTKTVTVKLVSSSSSISKFMVTSGANGVTGSNGSATGNQGCDCAPVTVTVALSTVTVTYSPMGASPIASTIVASGTTSAEGVKAPAEGSPAATASTAQDVGAVIFSSSTLCNNAPYGNGTECRTKSTHGTGTGFLTRAKPTGTMSAYYE